ncbi:3-isopropylmalate dehydratase large subunit [Acrocarpospora pleiomorpha]|uniref:3-isopropylmalate dehydratase large subunit n=1 Tax=Acrocarpospora pleiomorpha TaxID=90975 RepID=A0A5M3XUY3_9ACTN|nr:aconitase/3-isopropylmalate dehydratase large subunit family protein [Acrocarpospora pleiomorpha]GES24710.1 3-isopropylmalate dehydratase large subunit [Acrocarpospora pleiomorpha]
MGMTIAEKILARGAQADVVRPGDLVTVKVDTAIVLDMNFIPGMWDTVRKMHDPSRVIVIHDHLIPARDVQAAEAMARGREFVERWGIERFHDVGGDQGIVHQVVADRAYGLPGEILVCCDSHTCSVGVLNCAGRGLGTPELAYVLCKGTAWFKVGETVRYELHGELPPVVATKDVFLRIAGEYGSHEGMNLEYAGPGIANLSLDARRTLSTMAAELSAEFAIWEPDDVLLDYVAPLATRPYEPVWPDAGADYRDVRRLDLAEMEPYIGLPDKVVHNAVPITELRGPVKVDQCFIGSCANGTLDDIASAAQIVHGQKVAPGVRLIVTPGSQQIYREAMRLGYIQSLMDAGAVVTPSSCGACGGLTMGLLAGNETCITSSTRNFKGRMGSRAARIYMGSSATVAASALAGEIVDPRTAGGAQALAEGLRA